MKHILYWHLGGDVLTTLTLSVGGLPRRSGAMDAATVAAANPLPLGPFPLGRETVHDAEG